MDRKTLPVGIDDYKKIIDQNYYYVDKTLFIKELIDNLAEVNLFTRPRRFGKTLNLSMLRYFFERPVDGKSNAYLFENKKILTAGEKYTAYQEQYPVIQLSLKSGKQPDFSLAYKMLKTEIIQEFERHRYVLDSLESNNQKIFQQILDNTADDSEWYRAVAFLSKCLEKYHRQKVLILIDEYDVPLENAYYRGFYTQMTDFIRSLFESALKSNLSLRFAVITGCLRISRESIFTGLNNLKIISVLNTIYSEHFGFTQEEVSEMLSYYHLEAKSGFVKEWYDGYIFGKTEVYNPWSVVNFVCDLCADIHALPVEYWSNTSSNTIIRDLLEKATDAARDEIEILLQHGTIKKTVYENITYQDIHESEDNLWNFLYFTGYLKAVKVWMEENQRMMELEIPNIEVLNIYRQQVLLWSNSAIHSRDLSKLFHAALTGEEKILQTELVCLLSDSISYMDNYENFYHGFLLGIFMNIKGYKVTSNRESGNGRYDLCIVSRNGMEPPVILEFKIAKELKSMEASAEEALQQIVEKHYDAPFEADGYGECVHIGISFYKKACRVKCQTLTLPVQI